jgi:hypothetical protein
MKDMKSMKKDFTQLQKTKEDDSNISDYDASKEASHFQFADCGFQFTQVKNELKPQIAKLFKQMQGAKIKLVEVKLVPISNVKFCGVSQHTVVYVVQYKDMTSVQYHIYS